VSRSTVVKVGEEEAGEDEGGREPCRAKEERVLQV
jgi:hypothetical protein